MVVKQVIHWSEKNKFEKDVGESCRGVTTGTTTALVWRNTDGKVSPVIN
jgi:hypothetical protein